MDKENIGIELYIIRKSLNEHLTEYEKQKLELWLNSSEANRAYYERAKRYPTDESEIILADANNAYAKFKLKTSNKKTGHKQGRNKRKGIIYFISGIAASVALVFYFLTPNKPGDKIVPKLTADKTEVIQLIKENGDTVFLNEINGNIAFDNFKIEDNKVNFQNDTIKAYEQHIVKTPKGKTISLRLPDGSEVMLNESSTLSFQTPFANDSRGVTLEGEAYFQIAKGTVPFDVKHGNANVRAYGTVFNVNAYNPMAISTLLIEGSIGIRPGESEKERMVIPGQLVAYAEDNPNMLIRNVKPANYTVWINQEFEFQAEPLDEILNSINAYYKLKPSYFESENLRSYKLSAKLKANRSMEELIDMLAETANLSMSIKNNRIEVKPSK